ncbi:transcription factor Opi1, partial [Lentinula edodes]
QSQAISSAHMHKLTSMRRDVILTVREVVSVVSKYGGSAALPEPARKAMKSFILKLPKKVGEAMKMSGPSPEMHAGMSLAGSISGSRHGPSTISAGTAVVAAQRILTLATESMDMMRGVTGVVRESLERADAWVERLKTIGVQR